MVKLQTNGKDANSIFYSGVSYLPLGIGQKFTIENKTVEHNLLVIEVTHNSEVHGNYSCTFKAIPADVAAPHYTNVHAYAKAETQPAKVIDNNDPEGMGRVKVEFHWAGGNMKSDWMRQVQPYAGEGRGFYMTPEIGDEVLVDFVGGSAERPYVIGSHYNGNNKSGYDTAKNDMKVIHTRSGNRIISNDDTGDITIESQKGKTIAVVHGDGNIRFKAPKSIEFEAGEDIVFSAGKDIRTTAGVNISESAGVDKSTTVGAILHTTVGGDSMLNVTGKLHEIIEGDVHSESKQGHTTISEKKVSNHSEDNHEFHSKTELKNNSAEKTKQN
jgi:uncharacterized protein involved in type VI secretion and phage assembly